MCLTDLSQSLLLARVGFPQNNLLWRIKRDNLETMNVVKNGQNRKMENVLIVACLLTNCLEMKREI